MKPGRRNIGRRGCAVPVGCSPFSGGCSQNSRRREWVEVRKVGSRSAFNYFFSIIRCDAIDVITTSTRYIKPRKPRLFVPNCNEGGWGKL